MMNYNARDRRKKLIRDSNKTNKRNCKVYAALQHVVKRALRTRGIKIRMVMVMVMRVWIDSDVSMQSRSWSW